MCGNNLSGGTGRDKGSLYSFNPVKHAAKFIAGITGDTGAPFLGIAFQAPDDTFQTITTLKGCSNERGQNCGTIVRVLASLTK